MSRSILLADDSVTIQKVIELTFMDGDFEVVAVGNGDDAIAKLAELTPDFVIADVHMPGASGYEVCRRAKELNPEVPVLLLVGTFEPFEESEAEAAGAEAFLKKPFDSQELLQLVEQLTAGAAAEAEAAGAPAAVADTPEPAAVGDETAGAEAAAPAEEVELDADTWGGVEGEEEGLELEMEAPEAEAAEPEEEVDLDLITPEGEQVFSLAEDEPPSEVEEELEETVSEPVWADLDAAVFDSEVSPPPDLEAETDAFAAAGPGEEPELEAAAGEDLEVAPEEAPGAEEELAVPPEAPAAAEPQTRVPAAAETPAPVPSAAEEPPAAAVPSGSLSSGDVDRIARRVVELIGEEAIREIAWEVVPDMAEVVIRQRLEQLEAQVE